MAGQLSVILSLCRGDEEEEGLGSGDAGLLFPGISVVRTIASSRMEQWTVVEGMDITGNGLMSVYLAVIGPR